jgi:enoyl-CoA hydratase
MITTILFEENGPIGKIILNNPDQLNAMTLEMAEELAALIPSINQKPDIRVVLITGAGRAFSAGGNLQFILDHTGKGRKENKKEMVEFYSKFLALRDIEVPTLAVMNGPAMGAGLCIAMACDMRLAGEDARMGVNFAKIGLSSGMGGLYFLTRLVGPAAAADLLFTGRTLTAEEAHRLGLVNQVFPADELMPKALEIAEQIAQNAPLPLKIMKKGIQKASLSSLEEIFDYESSGQAEAFATRDLQEGVKAIQEKRPPKFTGK